MLRPHVVALFFATCQGACSPTHNAPSDPIQAETVETHTPSIDASLPPYVEPSSDSFRWGFLRKSADLCEKNVPKNECPREAQWVRSSAPIRILGDAPYRGRWRILLPAPKKGGESKRAWANEDNVRLTRAFPGLAEMEEIARDPETIRASDDEHPTARELADATKRDLVVLHSKKLRFVEWSDIHSSSPYIFVDWGEDSFVLELPLVTHPFSDQHLVFAEGFLPHHKCFLENCNELAYLCAPAPGYCDEVSFVAKRTGQSIPVPRSVRSKWNNQATTVPVLRAHALVDRFGSFPMESGVSTDTPYDDDEWSPAEKLMLHWQYPLFEDDISLERFVDPKLGLSYMSDPHSGSEERPMRRHICGKKRMQRFLRVTPDSHDVDCESIGKNRIMCREWVSDDHGSEELLIFDWRNGRPLLRGYASVDSKEALCSHAPDPCPYTPAQQEKDILAYFQKQRSKRCK